jgi:hypothetical protein
LRGNRVVLLNGRPIAAREGHAIRRLADVDDATRQKAERLLTVAGATRRDTDSMFLLNRDWDIDSLAGQNCASAIPVNAVGVSHRSPGSAAQPRTLGS